MMVRWNCYYSTGSKLRGLVQNSNTSCWAGVRNIRHKYIYIDQFKEESTKRYIKPLLYLINKITETELVKIRNKEYIKYKIIGSYPKDLMILNFIRNLWHEPFEGYADKFFKEMMANSKYKDPLLKLTYANKLACKGKIYTFSTCDHSNAAPYTSLVLRTKDALLKGTYNSHQMVMTNSEMAFDEDNYEDDNYEDDDGCY